MNTWTNYSLTCSYKKSSSRVMADICIDNRLTARLKVFFNLETGRGWWMELPTQFALGPHSETYEEYDVLKKKSEKIVNIIIGSRLLEKAFNSEEVTR